MIDKAIDIVHKTIYEFFDKVDEPLEEPLSEKDLLLLEVNKVICNRLRELGPEPKHGHWEHNKKIIRNGHNRDSGRWYADTRCSVCHMEALKEYRYCPNCGARMDGGENG